MLLLQVFSSYPGVTLIKYPQLGSSSLLTVLEAVQDQGTASVYGEDLFSNIQTALGLAVFSTW